MLSFTFSRIAGRTGPRLGKLAIPARKDILTPGYLATTSRGTIPHITPDNQRKHMAVSGVYMPLEDFVDRPPPHTPPIYTIPSQENLSRLRNFTAQPDDTLMVLGPRRPVPVDAPLANSNECLTICTAVGFRHERVEDYVRSALKLEPDIFIGPADVTYAERKSVKRVERMLIRTECWMEDLFTKVWRSGEGLDDPIKFPAAFMPVLPTPTEQQSLYLLGMVEYIDRISGLAIYDPTTIDGLPERLLDLPRLSLHPPTSPLDVLRFITLGIDILTIPFIAAASDAGIALSFTFPPPETPQETPIELGTDLFPENLAGLQDRMDSNCSCYACANSSRGYMQHLLSAKEMTGWVFLQIHNHTIMDNFFAGIRKSMEAGRFQEDRAAFKRYYVSELPAQTGAGPRVRGYQYKSEGPNERKKNPVAFRVGEGQELPVENNLADTLAEAAIPNHQVSSSELEKRGLGEVAG